jgi:hypothetical protein
MVIVLVLPSLAGVIQAISFYQKHPASTVLQLAIVAATVPVLFWAGVFLIAKLAERVMTLRQGNRVLVTAGEYAGRTGRILSRPISAACMVNVRLDDAESTEIEISAIILQKKGFLAYIF